MSRSLLLLCLLACDGAADSAGGGPGADADTDTDADTDADTDTGGISPDAPVVTITGVQCAPNSDSNPMWVIDGTVTDPQGEDNISVMDNYAVIVQEGQEGERHAAVVAGGSPVRSASAGSSAARSPRRGRAAPRASPASSRAPCAPWRPTTRATPPPPQSGRSSRRAAAQGAASPPTKGRTCLMMSRPSASTFCSVSHTRAAPSSG